MHQDDSETEIKNFDLYLAGNLIHELGSFFEQMASQVGQRLEQHLIQLLQKEVTVSSETWVEQTILKSNHDQTHYRSWVVINDDHNAYGAFAIEKQISRTSLDLICGGSGREDTGEESLDPTKGEFGMLENLIVALFDCVYEVCKPLTPIRMALTSKAEDAMADRLYKNQRTFVVCTNYTLTMAETTGQMQLYMPSTLIATTGISNRSFNREHIEEQLKQALASVELPVSATLGKQTSTLRQVISLKQGDILPLTEPMEADVFVSDRPFCQAKIFTNNNRISLQIDNSEKTSNEELSSGSTVDKPRSTRLSRSRGRNRTSEQQTRKQAGSSEPRPSARIRNTPRVE